MKKILIASCLLVWATFLTAQESKPSKIGWFITPEVGVMFLENHVGKTIGASFGVKLWKDRLKVGIISYGRPGPINSYTVDTKLSENQTYLGKSSVKLRADWGVIGAFIAPTFKFKKFELDLPIGYGVGAGGFYLHGDDRKTPDGARVSVWEDKLFKGEDAAAGGWTEFGARVFFPSKIKGMSFGGGVHYTLISGWKTFADPSGDFYNQRVRVNLFVNFGSH